MSNETPQSADLQAQIDAFMDELEPSMVTREVSDVGVRGMCERVDRLGGDVRVDSTSGVGTRLHVEIVL